MVLGVVFVTKPNSPAPFEKQKIQNGEIQITPEWYAMGPRKLNTPNEPCDNIVMLSNAPVNTCRQPACVIRTPRHDENDGKKYTCMIL